jgi:hypothetical protein
MLQLFLLKWNIYDVLKKKIHIGIKHLYTDC